MDVVNFTSSFLVDVASPSLGWTSLVALEDFFDLLSILTIKEAESLFLVDLEEYLSIGRSKEPTMTLMVRTRTRLVTIATI